MDKITLLKLINNNILEIETLLSSLSLSYNIPELESKLIKSKLKILMDEIEILGSQVIDDSVLIEGSEKDIKPTETEKPELKKTKEEVIDSPILNIPEKEIVQTEQTIKKVEKPDMIIEVEKRNNLKNEQLLEQGRNVVQKKKISSVDINESIDNSKKDKIVRSKKIAKNGIVADSFEVTRQSINDLVANSHKTKDLASKLKDKPINDLKKAISINDKIRYIKELFKGNADQYSTAIEKLNSCQNLDDALIFLNENFNWDQDKDSFRDFLELIYRRFVNA